MVRESRKNSRKKVFDPFFTKEPGKGTGLGHWVSYDIIKKMEENRSRKQNGRGNNIQ